MGQLLVISGLVTPAVGTVIPMSAYTGVGEAVNINFYGEVESACED